MFGKITSPLVLILYFPMFPFDPPENMGDQKGTLGSKGLIKIGAS